MTRRRLFLGLVALYLVLLAASHLVRSSANPDERPIPPQMKSISTDDGLAIAYRDRSSRSLGTASPVLLLHGSPGSSRDFATLAPALATRFRTIAPDLHGFGHSSRQADDYSIRSHAASSIELLDRLEIPQAHLVGFSMGGGVALEIARQAPARARSITLLSAIGVQELELLGSYTLNHALHGLQLGALFVLHEGTPHFGVLDRFPLDAPYARNFYDTDQRPLRGVLEGLEAPTLIIHGRRDVLVPPAAAREHHRLVPQSELLLYDDNHFMIFRDGDRLAVPIAEFLERVERGDAATRKDALAERREAAARPFSTTDLPRAGGLALAILMLLLALATFASEDLASIGTGLLVAQGRIGFLAGVVACFAGILIGDLAIYLGGRFLGRPWLTRAPIRWFIQSSTVERGSRWFTKRGPKFIFLSRFLPGTRVATYFVAGLLGTGLWRFLLYLGVAVALWVPLIVGLAAALGSRLFSLFDVFARFALPGVVGLAIFGWLLFRGLRALITRRGRRLLVGRWRRLRHWEFWPPWAFYPPVLAKIARLGLEHRSLTVFTAANPAMPGGGFVGESKSAILAALDPRFVARYRRLEHGRPAAENRRQIDDFLSEHGLEPPVVLKPDVGERGSGVMVVDDARRLETALETAASDLIVQEFVPGVELGVFYVRRPDEERGRIFSITEKRLPTVTGDGYSTLEELILADERAVAMAPIHLERFEADLDQIPGSSVPVRLVDVGTHCRGAVFLDGHRFKTEALEAAVDEISRSYDGFFFGRYDLKAPDHESFARGQGIKVIELNGVTSEATHIYDPANSLGDAYRALFEQWQLAFEIGARNAADGAPVTPIAALLKMLWRRRLA